MQLGKHLRDVSVVPVVELLTARAEILLPRDIYLPVKKLC